MGTTTKVRLVTAFYIYVCVNGQVIYPSISETIVESNVVWIQGTTCSVQTAQQAPEEHATRHVIVV